jgi:hypothetical protein
MCEDDESLSIDCGVRYRERVDADGVQGLVATEYELLTEHVAFLFDASDLGPRDKTPQV